jgi:predicted Fe-Mo cluster-binding NifX family protein
VRIVVTANGTNLEACVSPVFGRCSDLVFVDTDTMRFEAVVNPEGATLRGAGFEMAGFVVQCGAQAVVTGNVGPNTFGVLQAAGVPVYLCGGGTVREAIAAYKAVQLQLLGAASVPTHSGTQKVAGSDKRNGLGAIPPVPFAPFAIRDEEMAVLEETVGELRDRLALVLERLDHLRNEGRAGAKVVAGGQEGYGNRL